MIDTSNTISNSQDPLVKVAIVETRLNQLGINQHDLQEGVKTLITKVDAIQTKLTLYEGKFGGIVLTMSVVGAALGYILHVAMSYLSVAKSP